MSSRFTPSYETLSSLELGTQFFQDCSTFENVILPGNLPALVYAAKASRTPYLTPSGPDAIGVTLVPAVVIAGSEVQVEAIIDDTRFSNLNGTEPTQNIVAAEYYIDVPPWVPSSASVSMSPLDGSFDSPVEHAVASFNTAGSAPGKHLVFVRGRDIAGNWGAVSATFFDIATGSADIALVIDSSGSMTSNDPNNMRKEGAKVFVDTAQNGDGIAVVDFDENVVVPWHMTPLTNDRTAVKAAIDTIDSSGNTNIGGGLQAGYTELQAGVADHIKAAVLMTDGQHNTGPNPTTIVPLYQAAGWPIYTIGLGSGVNTQLLQQIADLTGGSYFQLSNPDDLVNVYFEIIGAILGGTLYGTDLPPGGEVVELTVSTIGQTASPLACNSAPEGFEAGVPAAGWTVVSNEPTGAQWTTLANCGQAGNYTSGAGEAACASIGAFGTAEFDTELRTSVFNLAGVGESHLTYRANYQAWVGIDLLDLDLSTDAGATWTTILRWDESHGAFQSTPGETVTVDLTPWIGQANLMFRWRYYASRPFDWGWYAQVDDVRLNCSGVPTAVTLSRLDASENSPAPMPAPMPLAALPAAAGLALGVAALLRRKR